MIALMVATISLVPFTQVFVVDTVFEIPPRLRVSGEKGWTDWGFCAVSPDGARVGFIDPARDEVCTYDLAAGDLATTLVHTENAAFTWSDSTEIFEDTEGNKHARVVERSNPGRMNKPVATDVEPSHSQAPVRTALRKGRGRNEVNTPAAISFDRQNRLLVSDLGTRRVSLLGPDGSLASSFLMGGDETVPSEIRGLPNGDLLCANLKLDPEGRINSGHHCNQYSPIGVRLRSLAYTPSAASERNLWDGVAAVLDVDRRGNAYVAFSVDPEIHVYDSTGRESRTFGGAPPWFVFPPALRAPMFEREVVPPGFWESWTRLIKIVCVGDDHILRVALANGRIPGTDRPFVIDISSASGTGIATAVTSDAWPVGADTLGNIYLLTITGDRLLKAHLAEAPR